MPNAETMNAARPKCHHVNKSTGFWCGLPLRLKLEGNTGQYVYRCPVHGLKIGIDRAREVKPEAVAV